MPKKDEISCEAVVYGEMTEKYGVYLVAARLSCLKCNLGRDIAVSAPTPDQAVAKIEAEAINIRLRQCRPIVALLKLYANGQQN